MVIFHLDYKSLFEFLEIPCIIYRWNFSTLMTRLQSPKMRLLSMQKLFTVTVFVDYYKISKILEKLVNQRVVLGYDTQ